MADVRGAAAVIVEPPGEADRLRRVGRRSGIYAGCVWLFIGWWLMLGALWGLGLFGPSVLPAVIGSAIVAVMAFAYAVAFWTGFGGRRVAASSVVVAFVLVVLDVLAALGSGEGLDAGLLAVLFAVPIILTSAFAYRYRYGPASRTRRGARSG